MFSLSFSRPASSVGLVVALVALTAAGCSREESGGGGPTAVTTGAQRGGANRAQPVEVTPVTRRDLAQTLVVVGSLAANEAAEVRPEVAGIVRGIFFEEGQPVQKDDVLVKIDDAELRAQAAQVEARHELARLNVERSENLSESRTIAQSEVDRARSEFAAAQAELALLRLRLEKTEVRAPFDGVVAARTISPGDYVTASSVITTISDLSRLKIEFQVPERFAAKVRPGTRFSVAARGEDGGAGEPVAGEVYFVSAVIDRSTRSSEVKGLLADPPAGLKPGMFANVELVLEVRADTLTVPEGAILATPRGTQVIAVRESEQGSTVEFVPVRVGLRARGLVEIAAMGGGLDVGVPVVASGVGGIVLFPGARVEPRPLRDAFLVR